jgi:hypothetical protein
LGLDDNGVLLCAKVGHVERLHVEELLALELGEQFKTLKTSSLVEVSGDSTRSGTRSNQSIGIVLGDTSGCALE